MFLDNIESLSVDELLQKQIELRQKMSTAMNTGMSPAILAQMQNMLDHISVQIRTRSAQDELDNAREAAENASDINGTSLDIG